MGLYRISESVRASGLPSDMNLKIRSRSARYNNVILVYDNGFSLGKNDTVNTLVLSHKTDTVPKHAHQTSIVNAHTSAITHEEEKIALVLVLTSAFGMWCAFRSRDASSSSEAYNKVMC